MINSFYFQVALDPSQTLLSSSISTSGSTTTLLFRRKLNNGGAVPIAESAFANAIWALGTGTTLADHGPLNRGGFVLPVTSAAGTPPAGVMAAPAPLTVASVPSSAPSSPAPLAPSFGVALPPPPPPPVVISAVTNVITAVSFKATFPALAAASFLADSGAVSALKLALTTVVSNLTRGVTATSGAATVAALYSGSVVAEVAIAFPPTVKWSVPTSLQAYLATNPALPASAFPASVGAASVSGAGVSSVTPGPACAASTLGYACQLAVTPALTVHWNLTVYAASQLVDELSVAVVAPAGTWVSLGFTSSAGSMVASDAVIGWVDAASGGHVGAYRLSGYSQSEVRPFGFVSGSAGLFVCH